MSESWVEDSKHSSAPESVSCSIPRYQSSSPRRPRKRNIFHLLAQREVSPRTKHQAKKLWTKSLECDADSVELAFWVTDARHDLFSWAESQSLHRWSAKYCPILPAPRSTIAVTFSPDGRTLASTHGDHTVKIIDCETGQCLKVLSGHQRTPWVVRYHPLHSDTVASGSLDQAVFIWDAQTSRCIRSHLFYKPIASIAFHAKGELLAVASGHKLFIWDYNKRNIGSHPPMVLRTRRSLRAVQFHPHGAPYLLTAEVNNLHAADSELTHATSSGYSNSPSAVFFANINSTGCPYPESRLPSPCLIWPAFLRDDGSVCLVRNDLASGSSNVQQTFLDQNLFPSDAENQQVGQLVTPMDVSPGEPGVTNDNDTVSTSLSTVNEMCAIRGQYNSRSHNNNDTTDLQRFSARDNTEMSYLNSSISNPENVVHSGPDVQNGAPMHLSNASNELDSQVLLRNTGRVNNNSIGGSHSWELPFLQGWLMARSHTGLCAALPNIDVMGDLPIGGSAGANNPISESPYMSNFEHVGSSSSVPTTTNNFRGLSENYTPQRHLVASVPGVGSSLQGTQIGEAETHTISLGIGTELATSLFGDVGADSICTVKLRIWRHNMKYPCAPLAPEACCLTISHAVLCSEMGTHFSPCGRFLVACVACLPPQTEGGDHMQYDSTGAGTSPTRHPLPSHRVIYELRIYSLEEATFGTVLASRAIRAAHCLTSIQFSPTSEHILLAYGRRHNSLLRSIFMDGETTIPIYTVLEVYRVSDMELVRVLPSAEDEVNVACFHPSPGAGLVYGTKEGKLRIIQHNVVDTASMGLNFFTRGNMPEIQRHAL